MPWFNPSWLLKDKVNAVGLQKGKIGSWLCVLLSEVLYINWGKVGGHCP